MVTKITNHSGQKTREETETKGENIQKFHPKMINSEIITELYIYIYTNQDDKRPVLEHNQQ